MQLIDFCYYWTFFLFYFEILMFHGYFIYVLGYFVRVPVVSWAVIRHIASIYRSLLKGTETASIWLLPSKVDLDKVVDWKRDTQHTATQCQVNMRLQGNCVITTKFTASAPFTLRAIITRQTAHSTALNKNWNTDTPSFSFRQNITL